MSDDGFAKKTGQVKDMKKVIELVKIESKSNGMALDAG
jgi:hypothetical protein